MTVKEVITMLLDCDLNKSVTIEYPTADGHIIGNYSRYDVAENFELLEYPHGVVIGISDDNK